MTLVGDTTFTAAVSGAGNFFGPGTATFAGGYSPGASPAEVSFAGGVALAKTNSLFIEIGGPTLGNDYDSLTIAGVAKLDGLLSVSLAGFTPTIGQQFTVLTASSLMDNGLLLSGPTASSFNLIVGTTSVILEAVAASGLPGDYNGNGIVDAADYTVWRNHFGAPAGTLLNDPAGGAIGTAQYAQWKSLFGQAIGAGSGASLLAAVPEPAALVTLVVGMLLMLCGRSTAVAQLLGLRRT